MEYMQPPSRVEAIQHAPTPHNVTELHSVLGMINYYGEIHPKYVVHQPSSKQSTAGLAKMEVDQAVCETLSRSEGEAEYS